MSPYLVVAIIVLIIATAYPLARFIRWVLDPIISSFTSPVSLSYTPSYQTETATKQAFPKLITSSSPFLVSSPSVHISLVVPSYNEELRLPVMLDETIGYLQSIKSSTSLFSKSSLSTNTFTWEIIVVNDGSKDKTSSVAQSYVNKYGSNLIRVMDLAVNQGKGGAVQQVWVILVVTSCGILHSRGEYILMVDADGATKISDLEKVIKALDKIQVNGHGMAIGSRAHLEENAVATRAWYRNILMYGFHFAVAILCVRGIADTQCGFKLFTRNSASILCLTQQLRRWCFDVELLFLAHQYRVPIAEVAVNWHEVEGSKLALMESSLLMARDLVIIRFCYMLRVWKLFISEKSQLDKTKSS